METGADDYMAKPVMRDALLRHVKDLLNAKEEK
jgi:DNA-binding response OmpR family regulator